MINIIKNPVLIGLTIGIIIYLYMNWNEKREENKEKKRNDNKLFIPLSIGVLFWFIAHNYFNDNEISEVINDIKKPEINTVQDLNMYGGNQNIFNQPNLNTRINQIDPSYHVLKRGISIPNNLTMPDMLIDNF
jgi:hypothetical protein